jgi:endonuclease-8
VAAVPDEALRAALATARRLLARNVREDARGGIVTRESLRRGADDGLWVYRRAGRPCRRCGTAIVMRRQGPSARVAYFCPQCQPG